MHDSGAERALVADLAHELGVEFADLGRRHADRHRRPARRRACGHQPAGRVGHRRRHPQSVRRVPARDGRRSSRRGHRARRRPGHRIRRRHRLCRRGHRRRQAHRRADRGAGLGGVGDRSRRPRNGCGTAGFPCWREPAAGWWRSDTSPAGHWLSTTPSPTRTLRDGHGGPPDWSPACRRSSCWPTTAFLWWTSRTAESVGAALQAARCSRISRRPENRCRPAQERCRRCRARRPRRCRSRGGIRGDGRLARARGDRGADGRGRRRDLGRDRS